MSTNLKSEISNLKSEGEPFVKGIVKSWLNGVKFGFVAPDTDYDFDVFVPGDVVPLRQGEAKLHIGEPVEFIFELKQYRTVCTKLRFPDGAAGVCNGASMTADPSSQS